MSPRFSALILAGIVVASPGAAQTYSTVPQPQSDADALGAAMRTLATNPQNIDALITAGELSLRVGDASGAAALFARADKVDPRNGRVKAGMASILVHEERPGEALRYFDQAVGYGLPPARFAAERGLAYDLIGEQERAQRDYRLALASGPNDEVVRRYGLSLGIAGKQQAALDQLDTLIRKGDRGAWRARAFVLAMNGDVAGANKIATTMMPPGMAQGLGPFFQRLPALSAADRAFAVHYGETRPTPERIADARMVPALPPLAPEPGVALAATQPVRAPVQTAAVDDRKTRRDRRNRREPERVQTGTATPAVTPTPQAALPSPPAYAAATVQPLPGRLSTVTPAAVPLTLAQRSPATSQAAVGPATPPPTALAMLSGRSTQPIPYGPARTTTTPAITARSTTTVAPTTGAPLPSAALPTTTRLAAAGTGGAASPSVTATPTAAPPTSSPPSPRPTTPVAVASNSVATPPPATAGAIAPRSTNVATPPVAAASVAPPPSVAASSPAATVLPRTTIATTGTSSQSPTLTTLSPRPAIAATPAAVAPARAIPLAGRSAARESSLASIIAGISVPASELAVTPAAAPLVPRATRVAVARAATGARTTAPTGRKAAQSVAAEEDAALSTDRRKGKTLAALDDEPKTTTDRRRGKQTAAAADAAAPTADRKGRATKDADRKLTPAEKRAADKKALADKDAADERKAAKADPERIWVQVAGGANEGDLTKAWRAQQGKAAALKGRAAYATPLRATNRVVTGPFKTDAEARAFVNQLAKQGVSAFPFTSEKGQKMTKLSTQ